MPVLRPGHHLYRVEQGWRHAAPGDRFVRIAGPAAALRQFQSVVHGVAAGPDVRELREAFAQRGLLAEPVAEVPARPQVLLGGTGPVADAIAGLLGSTADLSRVATAAIDEGGIAAADVLISCAGWLPDRSWQQIDGWCRAGATPWHRCHAEGTSFLLGPLTVPGATAGYTDVRGRRLAASGVPDELRAHWHYLDDTSAPHPPVPWPGPGAVAVVAGLLVDDVLRWWRTRRPDPIGHQIGHQIEVTTDPITVIMHPVLPLPVTAS